MSCPSLVPPGLRERKKLRTRRAILDAAYPLFAEQGFEATTVDQIAAAADVSTSTFFRYFPTKEDLVFSEDEAPHGPSLTEVLCARPAEEPPLTALRHAIRDSLAQARTQPGALERARQRMLLVAEVPSVRARLPEVMARSDRALAEALAERTGRPVDSLETRVLVGAVLGGFREALQYWATAERDTDVGELVDRALDTLTRQLSD
ncbi:TetR family transcriptional regulator [Streptomyces sp. DSM 44915]|uniref:TetR family transcriptional regulator n=1 Tax=Streptomyces chisholmiae TaxID=3075540 RepID=A0ABU2JK59_9ACTN|nr:TetR family transcriptional regulator [Streptomyces sp. DSM 44915]MDT0265368.1 TetR family transcriptional regulator [Streptomyces sp. DSM 44915]